MKAQFLKKMGIVLTVSLLLTGVTACGGSQKTDSSKTENNTTTEEPSEKRDSSANEETKTDENTSESSNETKTDNTSTDSEGDAAVQSVLDGAGITADDTADKDKLQKAYDYILKTYDYTPADDPDLSSDKWVDECASNMVKYGDAKCYNWAALTGLVAKKLGFNAKILTGTAQRTEDAEEQTAHAWVLIDDKYVLDTCYDDVNKKEGDQYFYQTYRDLLDNEGSVYTMEKEF